MISNKLNKTIIQKYSYILDIHPSLNKLYPVAITNPVDNKLVIYDINDSGKYEYVCEEKIDISLPEKVRASFPVDFYNSQSCCIVSEDIFNEANGFITFFHEFVHCYQHEECEDRLKSSLSINQKYDNAFWELDYPFPYIDKKIIVIFKKLQGLLQLNKLEETRECFINLKSYLDNCDYEYMIWQMWKEGLARYIENCIRKKYEVNMNVKGEKTPYNRISFYYFGEQLISCLYDENKNIVKDIEKLFLVLFQHEY